MTQDRVRTQATLLTDASIGLMIAPLADDHWEQADTAYHALEPSWHTKPSD
ncbi:hypothetical protein ACWDFL_39055 [Streptomyces bungoensis]